VTESDVATILIFRSTISTPYDHRLRGCVNALNNTVSVVEQLLSLMDTLTDLSIAVRKNVIAVLVLNVLPGRKRDGAVVLCSKEAGAYEQKSCAGRRAPESVACHSQQYACFILATC